MSTNKCSKCGQPTLFTFPDHFICDECSEPKRDMLQVGAMVQAEIDIDVSVDDLEIPASDIPKLMDNMGRIQDRLITQYIWNNYSLDDFVDLSADNIRILSIIPQQEEE